MFEVEFLLFYCRWVLSNVYILELNLFRQKRNIFQFNQAYSFQNYIQWKIPGFHHVKGFTREEKESCSSRVHLPAFSRAAGMA